MLQEKSCLTFLFKVYYNRFGTKFFEQILSPIIDKVMEVGDLGIKEDPTRKQPEIADLMNWSLDKILSGEMVIPNEFKHVCSVLKSCATTTLRTRRAVFKALSSFLCLKFMTMVIADPSLFDPTTQMTHMRQVAVVPFAQMLQVPLSLHEIADRYPGTDTLSNLIVDRYEDIYNFVLGAAHLDQPVLYAAPSEAACNQALMRLMETLSTAREEFMDRYVDVYENDWDQSGASFAMSDFIAKMFK